MSTSFETLYHKRRSVRKYTDQKISNEVLDKILAAGCHAPSAHNNQPWHFYVITDGEAREKLCSCYNGRWFYDAAAYILVVGKKDEAWVFKDGKSDTTHIDTAIAMTHMILEATDLGVGSTWVCAFNREKCADLFGFDFDHDEPVGIVALGYPAEDPANLPHIRREIEESVTRL